MKPWNVEICDVTLRDGEQTPGVSFTCTEKMEIASLLDETGVEVIEAGFPVVSDNEFRCVQQICRMGLDSRICCLARAVPGDIDAAIECEVDLVSIFIATSDLHMRIKYRCSPDEMLERALGMVDYAHDHGIAVRFAAEDASRTDHTFLQRMYAAGAEHGAEYSGFADTLGFMTPVEMIHFMEHTGSRIPNKLAVHCHNDLGCATANTITAAEYGAFQLHTTVNGIGERTGNARLEEVLALLRLKGGVDRYDLTRLPALSKKVEECSGIVMMDTKPVVGKNAFSHESGIHIAAMIEDPEAYEYLRPETVGRERQYILGKHTGRKAIEHVIASKGCSLTPGQMHWLLCQVKKVSEGKCRITDEVLMDLLREAHKQEQV
ncbi:homocitrate synthase family protein [Methanogenium organophilum]|uniref:Homocitrate synthase family protein n=1 Tax=Methanogenium organophilum TaxID=2199 RepID=A0A9X9T9C9_METOG|nr:homocitrate synthase family protein [Methanogenium organophilum]WAI01977.1 homocitrate synthase family protein [Methanogenium organophilum]